MIGRLCFLAVLLGLVGLLLVPPSSSSPTATIAPPKPHPCRYTVAKRVTYGVEVTTITRICKLPVGKRLPIPAY